MCSSRSRSSAVTAREVGYDVSPGQDSSFCTPDFQIAEFNIKRTSGVERRDEPLENIALSEDRKVIVQVSVRTRSKESGFDEITNQRPIFNSFGPPGCGKTPTTETTSERV